MRLNRGLFDVILFEDRGPMGFILILFQLDSLFNDALPCRFLLASFQCIREIYPISVVNLVKLLGGNDFISNRLRNKRTLSLRAFEPLALSTKRATLLFLQQGDSLHLSEH